MASRICVFALVMQGDLRWSTGDYKRYMYILITTNPMTARCCYDCNNHVSSSLVLLLLLSLWLMLSLFTPLRVGWPPTPQVYFCPWQDFLPPGILPMGAFSTFPPMGASQAREFQIATTPTPRKTVRTTFLHRYLHFFFYKIPQIPCFWTCLHVFAMVSFKAG